MAILRPTNSSREHQYFCYRLERGAEWRWGRDWATDNPERVERLQTELATIAIESYEQYFLILARILEWCQEQRIVTGPGRGSVGGSLACYVLGIHELDSLEWGLNFGRFMNAERVGLPDVDLDVSQRHRGRVLDWIKGEFEDEHTVVLQVAAFARAGARRTIDMVAAALRERDPSAEGIAYNLKKLLPQGSNVTGGTKQDREIAWWLENSENKNAKQQFVEMATKAGWMETLLKLDGVQTHLAKHAAGIVIIGREDLKRLPQTGARDSASNTWHMMTGYDMYMLDRLKVLKIDILGLRTLDIVSDAHKFCGGDGSTAELMKLWQLKRDDNEETYDLLRRADTTGVFQVETSGYRKTLKDFQPDCYDHITQLNALYRPGALDYEREDGKNMVEVFIDRRHHRERVTYPGELRDRLRPILDNTQGIILYQEQAMQIARDLAGFSDSEADNLRKAIGKKQLERMADIQAHFKRGMADNGYTNQAAHIVWQQIEASARYSWNASHARFYSIITWWTSFFKANRHVLVPELELDGPGTAGFYTALINSLDEDKERQADAVAEARQHVAIRPPDVNVALDSYTVDGDAVVFGFNGIKGMGEANRAAIIVDRWLDGSYTSFENFHRRLPSLPINMKLALVRCGAFDGLESRERLLTVIPKYKPNGEPNGKFWTIAEFIKHNCGLKKPRELPPFTEWHMPSQRELADGEMESIGFYVSADPMADVTRALSRLDPSCHWGGEIVAGSIRTKKDKRGEEMAWFTLLTGALNKQRCMVFASSWLQCKPYVLGSKGLHVIVRGRVDGTQLIIDKVFVAGDYRQFQVIETRLNGHQDRKVFDGQLETVEQLEAAGYEVRLL